MRSIKRGKKPFAYTMLVLMALFMIMPTMAFAADGDRTISVPSVDKVCEGIKTVKQERGTDENGTVDSNIRIEPKANAKNMTEQVVIKCDNTGGITFNKLVFADGTEKSKKEAMAILVAGLQESRIEDQHQQKIIDGFSVFDADVQRMLIPLVMDSTNADVFTALKWLMPFLGVVRVFFGIGAIVIVILLFASTVVDLCFIGLPVLRETMESKGEGKGGKIPFISSDAVSVVKDNASSADSSGSYKNPYVTYFIRRSMTYIILSICLLYLVLGELSGLISWLLSLGSGIVGS